MARCPSADYSQRIRMIPRPSADLFTENPNGTLPFRRPFTENTNDTPPFGGPFTGNKDDTPPFRGLIHREPERHAALPQAYSRKIRTTTHPSADCSRKKGACLQRISRLWIYHPRKTMPLALMRITTPANR